MKLAKLKCHLKLTFCFTIMTIAQLFIGFSVSFSSTLLTQLREPSSEIKLNLDEESWITSVSVLICPIGLIITGILTDRYGRKFTTQVAFVPFTLSWLIITYAESYYTLLIGKIIFGLPFGISVCELLYISEVCPANLRPVYTSMISASVGLGMMLECVLSIYFRWRTIAAISCAACAVNFVMLFAVPETPMWLEGKGRTAEADRVTRWFGLDRTAPEAADVGPSSTTRSEARDDGDEPYFALFLRPAVWKPALITLTFFVLQQGSGLYVLLFYSADVLRDCGIRWDGNTAVLCMSASRLLGSVCFGMLYTVRRRTLLVVSGGFMGASLLIIVAYMEMFKNVQDPPFEETLFIAFTTFMFFSLLGVLPLPWILCGEVFPMRIKGVMNGIVLTCGYLIWFTSCKIYPSMISYFGVEVVWSVFAAFCILNVLFGIFIMPETKGKSLDEILMYFESSKKKNIKSIA